MTSNNEDREIFVRTTIRELVVYCIFIVVLCLGKHNLSIFQQLYVIFSDFWDDLPNPLLLHQGDDRSLQPAT